LANIGKIKECDYLFIFLSSLLRAEKREEKQK
jgi:hypothetical protein